MSKDEYIKQCLDDALSCLDIANVPVAIQIGDEYIYPKCALSRIKNVLNADSKFARSK